MEPAVILLLISFAVCLLLAFIAGAWVFHRGRVGASPIPPNLLTRKPFSKSSGDPAEEHQARLPKP